MLLPGTFITDAIAGTRFAPTSSADFTREFACSWATNSPARWAPLSPPAFIRSRCREAIMLALLWLCWGSARAASTAVIASRFESGPFAQSASPVSARSVSASGRAAPGSG